MYMNLYPRETTLYDLKTTVKLRRHVNTRDEIIIKSLDSLRAMKTFIRKKLGHSLTTDVEHYESI